MTLQSYQRQIVSRLMQFDIDTRNEITNISDVTCNSQAPLMTNTVGIIYFVAEITKKHLHTSHRRYPNNREQWQAIKGRGRSFLMQGIHSCERDILSDNCDESAGSSYPHVISNDEPPFDSSFQVPPFPFSPDLRTIGVDHIPRIHFYPFLKRSHE